MKPTIMESDLLCKKPLISIICFSFNHGSYIEQTVRSIVNQELEGSEIELIIHDDCSTDSSKKILEGLFHLYPDKIKLVLQNENKYSKGEKVFLIPLLMCRGEYIAICDGDDYWLDNKKLYIQKEQMEKFNNIYISFHSAIELNVVDGARKEICKHYDSNRIVGKRTILQEGAEYMPTASLLFRNKNVDSLVHVLKDTVVSDFYIQHYYSMLGDGALYINKAMSVYRVNVSGSWNGRQNNKPKKLEIAINMMSGIKKLYAESKGDYEREFSQLYMRYLISALVNSNSFFCSIELINRNLIKKNLWSRKALLTFGFVEFIYKLKNYFIK